MVLHLRTLLISSCFMAFAACGGDSNPPELLAPSVEIGENQSVNEGESVALSPSVIDVDTEDEDLSYVWEQVSGPSVSLSSTSTRNISFIAPEVDQTSTITLRLTVSDQDDHSTSDTVNVVISNVDSPPNTAPIVDAGDDFNAVSGTSVTLNATVTDDDSTLTYNWVQIDGLVVSFSANTAEDPVVTLPARSERYIVTLRLSVSDGVHVVSDDVSITVRAADGEDLPPTVHAGTDQTVSSGSQVSLAGSATDDGASLTTTWVHVSGPAVTLDNASNPTTGFTAPIVASDQTIVLRLTADDGVNAMVSDEVNIHVLAPVINLPPVVNAGSGQIVDEGARVSLNASVTDDNNAATILWQQISGPSVVLSDANVLNPSFSAPGVDQQAVVVLRLSADDGVNDTVSHDVSITINNISENNPPVVNAGNDQTVDPGTLVSLSGSANDSDGDPLTLDWQQLSGPTVSLNNSASANASFTAPENGGSVIVLRFSADDDENAVVYDDIRITINSEDAPPQVTLSPEQSVNEGASFVVDAAIVDEGDYTVQWVQVSGPTLAITTPNQEDLTLMAPAVDSDQTIVLRLTVDDNVNDPVVAQTSITIRDLPANNPPTANAGADQQVQEGSVVTLSGTVTDDNDAASITWSQVSGPSVTLSNANEATAQFTAPLVTEQTLLEFRITADDGVNEPVSDTVVVTVENIAVVVNAGEDQTVFAGESVQLNAVIDGLDSPDITWSQLSGPTITFSNATIANPTFVAPDVAVVTQVEIRLSVAVPGQDSITDSLLVNVSPGADVNVSYAATARDDRLACYKGNAEAACNLRTYQVMAVSFIDGDSGANWSDAYGLNHNSGDVQGIINSLDYIQDLGMNAIWITPLFVSNTDDERRSSTGYFASNYFQIDSRFGSLEQARTLVDQAHARGIYVFFDGVFGHFWSNVEQRSYNGATLPSNRGSGKASYPADLAFFQDVATYWIRELKIDGWRLDVANEVPAAYWDDIRFAVEQASKEVTYTNSAGQTVNPLGYMVGEVWKGAPEIASAVYGSEGSPALLSAFDFPMRYAAMQTFAVEESWDETGPDTFHINGLKPASRLQSRFLADHGAYPSHAMPNLMLSNHDILRFGDLLQRGEITDTYEDEYWNRYRTVHSFQAAYSGPITLFYGEEIGQEVQGFANRLSIYECSNQNKCDDHVSRIDGKIEGVNASLTQRESALRDYIRSLMNLREQHPALPNGSRTHIYSNEDIYIDRKDNGDDNILYVVNVSDDPVSLALLDSAIGSEGVLEDLLGDYDVERQGDRYFITVPGHTAYFFDITDPTAEGPQQRTGSLTGTGPLADCAAPDSAEVGPLGTDIYIRGNYSGGDNFAATPASHALRYKGDNIYQVVISETANSFGFKFADEDWMHEFAVEASGAIIIGTTQTMAAASGPGSESSIIIPQTGDYVFSFQVNNSLDGGDMMVSLCP